MTCEPHIQAVLDTTHFVGNAPGAARLLDCDATAADPAAYSSARGRLVAVGGVHTPPYNYQPGHQRDAQLSAGAGRGETGGRGRGASGPR